MNSTEKAMDAVANSLPGYKDQSLLEHIHDGLICGSSSIMLSKRKTMLIGQGGIFLAPKSPHEAQDCLYLNTA